MGPVRHSGVCPALRTAVLFRKPSKESTALMRPPLFLVVLLAGTAWLFLTESGRRRRDQVMALLGRAPAGQGDQGPSEPMPFPQARGGATPATTPTSEDGAPVAAAPPSVPVPAPDTAAPTAS